LETAERKYMRWIQGMTVEMQGWIGEDNIKTDFKTEST
jgi:hypothetical protein